MMPVPYEEALSNILKYETEVQNVQESLMDVDEPHHSWQERLDRTVSELRERLEEQKAALERLRSTSASSSSSSTGSNGLRPSDNPRERLKQLHTIKAAYQSLSATKPVLPSPNSALPALLAARTLQQTISSTRTAIKADRERLARTQRRLDEEEAQLRDARLLTSALEDRLRRVRAARQQQEGNASTSSAAQRARELLRERKERQQHYEREAERLEGSLRDFVEGHLAAMLAAEELGGPVVGDAPDVDDEVLAAGFSARGKPRPGPKSGKGDGKRQKKIDEIWGLDQDNDDEAGQPRNEREAAAADFLRLMGELFEAQLARGADSYVMLQRDSAASRFLVRAKVAHFHPKDARRLRLVDFGRELDD